MSADERTGSDSDSDEGETCPREELYEAIVEFEGGDTPTEDEVRSAFLS